MNRFMTQLNFLYTQNQLQNIAEDIINKSLQMGATSAQVELSESISTDLEVLNQRIETLETSHENQLLLTVFKGHRKGNVGISSIKTTNLTTIIQQALDIATYTEEDLDNGLLEPEYLANKTDKNLNLYTPYNITNDDLIKQTCELESLAADSSLIKASDGASTSLTYYNFVTANSNGFNDGYQTSRFSRYVSLIGENHAGMQTDYWYTSARDFNDLENNHQIAELAQQRILRRLNRGEIKSSKPKIIFETQIAKSIIGSLMGALSGNSQYRKLSFLNDSLGTKIMPEWLSISEDPFIIKGLASCYFDNECGRVTSSNIIENGNVAKYLLSSYSARKLGMAPTGNSGGTHNLLISNNFDGNLASLAKEMDHGIIIIETIGHGLNMVTGDYSVGASGLLVKSGIICEYVDNLTISGNMKTIFNNIALIANDYNNGSILCGSMLINEGIIQVSSAS